MDCRGLECWVGASADGRARKSWLNRQNEGASQEKALGQGASGRKNCKCKGPESGECLCLNNSKKKSVA